MPEKLHYDYIIAGAGAAGLSLLWHLLNSSLKEKKILVIDKTLDPDNEKTWCFWDLENFPFTEIIHFSWDTLKIISPDGEKLEENLKTYKYHSMRSNQLNRHVISYAKNFDNVDFREAVISSVYLSGSKAVLNTEDELYSAEYIFQSVFKPADYDSSAVDTSLKQHFKGWEIETDEKMFNPEVATLMDFDIDQKNGFSFFYQLPVSETCCLFEYTLFSENLLDEDSYDSEIKHYLTDKFELNPSDYKIRRTEFGIIPMEDRRYSSWYNGRTLNIGTAGGWTKPSTGYTFSRIQTRCRKIVGSLESGKKPKFRNGSSYRFRVYDMMILYLIKKYPVKSVNIFSRLFKTSGMDRILTFLDEKTTIVEEISIFSKLPYSPFFHAIYKLKHRILTGA
ncbi:MAG TPA: lycopene cyclase family protein [Balneolaceae bacterium]|nr:lycopene cyclase family protein [Balneolaceae bacterium]